MSPGKTETVISKCTEDIGSEKSEISNRSVSSELMKSSTAAEIPLQTRPDIGLVSPGNGRGTRRDCVNIPEGLGCAAAARRISAVRDGNHTARNLHRRSLRFRNHHARDRCAAIPDDIETLLAAFKNVPVFVASIIVLGIFWRGH